MKALRFCLYTLTITLAFLALAARPVHAQPAADPEAQPFKVYLPTVAAGIPDPNSEPTPAPAKKAFGLAMAIDNVADLDLLNVSWYFNWKDVPSKDQTAKEFIPMSFSGKPTRVAQDYSGYMLVFNEPNNVEPYGCNLSAAEAALRYAQLRAYYPQAKLVVGGWSVFATDWAKDFVSELKKNNTPLPEYWHVHAYTESWITPAVAKQYLKDFHKLTGGTYWITEYGSPEGKLADFQSLSTWLNNQTWIERVSAYTNRQEHGAGWEIGSGVEMVNQNNELTTIGQYYANFVK